MSGCGGLRSSLVVAIWLAGMLVASVAQAFDWESLVSPGPLIAGHAQIETDCKGCHAPFARDEQRKLCLDCHEDVAGDISGRRGFHYRSEAARTSQCRNCHTDHEGREADVVRLVAQTFDHALADFALEGGHAGVACALCHEPTAKHRDAAKDCNGCHAADDPHRKSLGEDCAACHTATAWREANFDHREATDGRYPLTGGHSGLECGLCHAGQRYKDTPTACVACHRIDDVHAGQRGTACADCHDTGSWKKPTFDHLEESGFALTLGHGGLACRACHAGDDLKNTTGSACVDCHRSDDVHQGRNGNDCNSCHTAAGWGETQFDHAKASDFPLRGAHAKLTCVACHKGAAAAVKIESACASCHRADDPHRESLGSDCAACHGDDSWTKGVRFDHDLTAFPLNGLHAATACESCHLDQSFRGTPALCVDCHRADDAHGGRLGERCGDCHNPNDWRIWTFDHATQADFPLDGAHAGLECAACHRRPPGDDKGLSRDCAGCHRGDDVHGGQFGVNCARCHDTRSFSGARRMPR